MNAAATLPESPSLRTAALARVLDRVTSSHKFLWLLAILDVLQSPSYQGNNSSTIPLGLLVYHMLELAQATLEQFRLEQYIYHDRFQNYLELCRDRSQLFVGNAAGENRLDASRRIPRDVYRPLTGADSAPYRFLVPFLPKDTNITMNNVRRITKDMSGSDAPAPYHFADDGESIIIHPHWLKYLADNANIVRGWTLWHWTRFLESHNPNTPSLTAKITGVVRGSLATQRKLWDAAMLYKPAAIRCIYSGEALKLDNYSIDHYLPWEFVGHDNFWNLVPTLREVNSSKSDTLPADHYLEGLAKIHSIAIETYHMHKTLHRECGSLMLAYLTDLQVSAHDTLPNGKEIVTAYHRVIPALVALARNQGFSTGWQYRPRH